MDKSKMLVDMDKLVSIDEFVLQNVEQLSQMNNYLVKCTKIVHDKNDKPYNAPVTLQLFTDTHGQIILIREV
jgi:hypothetical protein